MYSNVARMRVNPMLIKNTEPEIFEGIRAEEYKRMKNKWIRLAIVGTGLPFVIGILVSIFNDTFSLLDVFGNGEIILLLFSLNLPMAFDLFDMKRYNDERLEWEFWKCVIIICLQVALYCLIRTTDSENVELKSISSVIMVFASGVVCVSSIKAMFLHSTNEDRGE